MKKIFLIIFLVSLLSFLVTFQAQAGLVPCGLSQDDPDQPGEQNIPCQLCHLFVLFKNIIDFLLFKIVPTLAILFLVIAGVMYMLAYLEVIGNPNWISQARSLIWAVVIGMIIIYGAWLIVNLFFQVIGINKLNDFKTLPQNWWVINCP